jgi:hypothetical protein
MANTVQEVSTLPSPAVVFFSMRDMANLLVSERYLPDLRDVFAVSRLNRRTFELLKGHPDLAVARRISNGKDEDWGLLAHAEPPSGSFSTVAGTGPADCLEVDRCVFLNDDFVGLGLPRPFTCACYQRYMRALYGIGNLRVAEFYMLKICDDRENFLCVDMEKLLENGHLDAAKRVVAEKGRKYSLETDVVIFSLALEAIAGKDNNRVSEMLEFLWKEIRPVIDKRGDRLPLLWEDVFITCLLNDPTRRILAAVRDAAGDQLSNMQEGDADAVNYVCTVVADCVAHDFYDEVPCECTRITTDALCYLIETGVISMNLLASGLQTHVFYFSERTMLREAHKVICRFVQLLKWMHSVPTMRLFRWRDFFTTPAMQNVSNRFLRATKFGPQDAETLETLHHQFAEIVSDPSLENAQYDAFLQTGRVASSMHEYMKFVTECMMLPKEEEEESESEERNGKDDDGILLLARESPNKKQKTLIF